MSIFKLYYGGKKLYNIWKPAHIRLKFHRHDGSYKYVSYSLIYWIKEFQTDDYDFFFYLHLSWQKISRGLSHISDFSRSLFVVSNSKAFEPTRKNLHSLIFFEIIWFSINEIKIHVKFVVSIRCLPAPESNWDEVCRS